MWRHPMDYEEKHRLRKNARRNTPKRLEQREHLRLEIEARDIIARMKASTMTLVQGFEEVITPVGDTIQQPLSRERIAALRVAAEIDKTMLDRVLPVLKPVEVDKPSESLMNPSSLSDNELRSLLAEFLKIDQHLIPHMPQDTNDGTDDDRPTLQ